MRQLHRQLEARASQARPNLSAGLARGPEEIREAQRLRYRIFAGELGATLPTRSPGLDRDIYDPWCDHLVVRNDDTGDVIGTCRLLSPAHARRVGYCAENEFDLTRLQHLRPRLMEVGRACVRPDFRNGATIALLWSEIARHMRANGFDYLLGCAAITMADGGHLAASLYRQLAQGLPSHLGPLEYRVFPRCPLPLEALCQDLPAERPASIKGYLRGGAWICGEPAWDPDFNTADLPVLLPLARLEERYARHFLGHLG